MVFVVVVHAADMERVARILALQIGAAIAIGGEGKIEPAGHEPAAYLGRCLGLCRS